jgi:non-homologous end joining protein Ku
VRIGEQRQFLVVQGVIGVAQCVTDRLSRHRMAGHRERGKGDGPIAVETLRVIGAAMAELGVVGIARLTLSRRERPVMVEPRVTGMALFTLRAAEEVRAAQFDSPEGDLDAEMVAIAGAIMKQRTGKFDPSQYRDRYQKHYGS